ncbi:hypothetical protein HWV62_17136 [Athelia sp. TMB]|nr:hypothetical protein HWV62_17136 [Athelia sp. TMB]
MVTSQSNSGFPSHLLVFNGIFYAYLLGSFVGLGKWIAVQQVPAATTSATDAVCMSRKKKIIAGCAAFAFFAIAFSFLAVYELEAWFEHFEMGAFLVIFSGLSSQYKVAELPRWKRVLMRLAVATLAIGLPTGAIWYRSDACASAMLFVVMFVAQGQQYVKTNSLRKLIINAAILQVAMIFHVGIIGAMVTQSEDTEVLESLELYFGRRDWLYTFAFAHTLSRLFSTALRFDYARQVEAAPTTTIIPKAVPAPTANASGKQLSTGMIAPSFSAILHAPSGGRKPYYFLSALMMYACSHIAVTVLISLEVLPEVGRAIYTVFTLLLSTPFILGSLFAVAQLRGETKQMWKYEEVWTSAPAPAVPVVEGAVVASTTDYVEEKVDTLVDV